MAGKLDKSEIKLYLKDYHKKNGKCIRCSKSVQWTTDRVESHIRVCKMSTPEEKRRFAKRKNDETPDSQTVDDALSPPASFHEIPREEIDEKLSNFFFRTGISFRLVDSQAFKDLVKALNPEYAASMPCSRTLSTTLLDRQYSKYSLQLQQILNTSNNLTLVSDGWTNIRGNHLVNFCIKTPSQKPVFYKSIETSGIIQNATAVAQAIIDVMQELGSNKFSCIVTDNAPVMKAAWKIIEDRFPNISAHGCAAHAINLLVKDISSVGDNPKIIKDAEKIIKFANNHHLVKSMLDRKRIAANVARGLSMPVSTRWFTLYNSMNDLLSLKYVLIQLVDEEYDTFKEIAPKPNSLAVLNLIKSNEFWDRLSKLVKQIEYPSKVIGKVESDDASLALVYHYFGEFFTHFNYDSIIQQKVKKRFDALFTPSIGLAYILTPKFAANGFFLNDEQIDIMNMASEIAEKDNAEDVETIEKVNDEMIMFVHEMATLAGKKKDTIYKMSSKEYWSITGRQKYPFLYNIAKPISEMLCSSATSERVWSIFRFIHSRLRNRLTNGRVDKLVFIYINSTLLDNIDKNDYITEDGAVLMDIDCDDSIDDTQ